MGRVFPDGIGARETRGLGNQGQSWEGIVAHTSDKSRSHVLCRPLPPTSSSVDISVWSAFARNACIHVGAQAVGF